MADEGQDLEIGDAEEGGSKKLIIIIAVVVLLVGGGAAAFFLMGGDPPPPEENLAEETTQEETPRAETGSALYVAMPRPFVFNVPGSNRDRLVQIKVQLMVRGDENEEAAQQHIPLIESTLLGTFSGSSADELGTTAGKEALRRKALSDVQSKMKDVAGTQVVERVLFTGFVLQ
ncbi:flagellar basal body-associated protein FliL [Algicola sagamiensis]|uniref:flagellar basal body-associated protein FliL n=1 Tax=Algicola sagamiensis TaxID=163869 RepID=UPI000375A1BA|nr:flagellar basal body-associated protein FliL [Algicola sagamiensis]